MVTEWPHCIKVLPFSDTFRADFIFWRSQEKIRERIAQRRGHDAGSGFDQQRDALKGVSQEVGGFGIGFRGLVKPLDSWHFLALFAYFEAIANEYQSAIDLDFARK